MSSLHRPMVIDRCVMAVTQQDFVVKPWCVLNLSEGDQTVIHKWFVVKKKHDCQYHLLISDGQNMWEEELRGRSIETRNKEMNPCMEVPVKVLLDHLSSLLAENSTLTWTVEERKQLVFKLTCRAQVQGFPFVWQFHLRAASPEMIALHLTLPFISMVAAQEMHQKELCKLIAKKDAEILDYRLSGATVSRKHLETKPFDEVTFLKDSCSKETMACILDKPLESACSDHLKELYKAVTEACHHLSKKPMPDVPGICTEDATKQNVPDPIVGQQENLHSETKTVDDPEANRRLELEKRLAQEEQQIAAKRKKKTIKL